MRLSLLFLCLFSVCYGVGQVPAAVGGPDPCCERADRLAAQLELKQDFIEYTNVRQNLYLLVIVLTVIFALILVFYYRLLQKGERNFSAMIVNQLEEERGRIARDLHDGLGQHIIVLKNKFNQLKTDRQDVREQLNAGFSEVLEEIRNISKSLIPPELKRLGLKKAIERRLNEITASSHLFVTAEMDGLDGVALSEADSLKIYRLIQELTTNTIKHAGATAIRIEILSNRKSLELIYQDNGIGLEKEKWQTADDTAGLRGIVHRVNAMTGTLKVEQPKKGFRILIKIPLH